MTAGPGLGEKGEPVFPLCGGDGTIQHSQPEPAEAGLVGIADFQQIARVIGGALADQVGVEQVERLGRYGRFVSFARELGGLGKVEDVAEPRRAGLRAGADHGQIKGALVDLRRALGLDGELGMVAFFREGQSGNVFG